MLGRKLFGAIVMTLICSSGIAAANETRPEGNGSPAVATGGSAEGVGVPTFDPGDPRTSFIAMADYLARDGGRWKAPNPGHDGSSGSPAAFGLWFDRTLDGHVLELQIVLHFSDRVLVSSRGHWVWHPAAGELRHTMIDLSGAVTEGVTTFPDARTFRTIAARSTGGGSNEHRDDNVLVSGSLHENESFQRKGGKWVSGGVYSWQRIAAAAASNPKETSS